MKKLLIIGMFTGLLFAEQYPVIDVKPIFHIEKECATTKGRSGTGEAVGGVAGGVVGGGVGAAVGGALFGRTGASIGGVLGGLGGGAMGASAGGDSSSTTCRDVKTLTGYRNYFKAENKLLWKRSAQPLDSVEFTPKKVQK